MLCLFFLVIPSLLIACSKDRPAPVAPASKAVVTTDAPTEPTNLRCEALTDTSARVAWDAVEGATDYDVNYKELPNGRWTNEPHTGTRLYNTIYDLKPNTEYRWAVRAENSDGPSKWVFAKNFTTDPPVFIGDGSFDIEIVFPVPSQFTQAERESIIAAAERWEEVIIGDVPDYVQAHDLTIEIEPFESESHKPATVITVPSGERIDDLRVYIVTGETNFDPWWGWSDANATYWELNPETQLPAVGRIAYKPTSEWWSPEWSTTYAERRFASYVAFHELGHILGIGLGPQWDQFTEPGKKAYSIFQQADFSEYGGNFFTGPNAVAALKRQPKRLTTFTPENEQIRRARYPNALSRPIGAYEDEGRRFQLYDYPGGEYYIGAGVPVQYNNWHWELLLGSDYMSRASWSEVVRPDISEVTLGALEDMGYTVDYEQANITPLYLDGAQYAEYLSEAYLKKFIDCTDVGALLGRPCDDPARYEAWKNLQVWPSGKPTISTRPPFLCGVDIH